MDVEVLRTAHRHELDIAAAALRDAGVPHTADVDTAGRRTQGVSHFVGGVDGVVSSFVLSVPASARGDALAILADLPVGRDPEASRRRRGTPGRTPTDAPDAWPTTLSERVDARLHIAVGAVAAMLVMSCLSRTGVRLPAGRPPDLIGIVGGVIVGVLVARLVKITRARRSSGR